ncbi:unnamed protein product [Rotaria sp. Silwood2]|nr:unnamed protein product [Rotaria sp. Silwood2]CAF2643415.1 unnamed protein product [Rotaria sp. Silwood2]CAF2920994.1 unnamed protein product [Rotaria sp. Silwood2]CAF3077475.1 unnamed protein product [Rotaria sp. Silwood2]CAF3943697.1 unnamed protein product [Rotaria sp. Silwood2]
MSVVNEDVLWLEPLLIENDIETMKTTLAYQIGLLSSSPSLSNISSSYLPILTNSSSITTLLSNDKRFLILKWSVRIIGCLLIIVGGIGNTLSALTLSRKKLRTQVTSVYLIALALSDLVRIDPNRNMRLYSNLSCKLHIFFTYYFINLSPTLLVAVSVQRYLAIAKHHYSKKHCTVKNAYTVIGLICLISFFIELHWGIFYELQLVPIRQTSTYLNRTISFRHVCNTSLNYPTYLKFRSNILGYIQWFLFTLCPFIIMLILNSLILNVIASARRIQQHTNQKNQRKKAKQRNLTIMLLSVSCVFILLTAPASTFMAFGHLFKNLHGRNSQSLWTMFSLIYYTNTAANFLLYFLTANVFRQELRVMISSLPGCSKILPEQFQILQNNTNMSGGVRLTPVGKAQLTTNPVITSATILCEDENINGINRKYDVNNLLTVNPNNRLLSITYTVKDNCGNSDDENSRL